MQNPFQKLGQDYQPIIKRLQKENLRPLSALKTEVKEYTAELKQEESEFLDLATAQDIAIECLQLIDQVTKFYSKPHHSALQVAIRYFVLDDDVVSDVDSIIGFDDDAEVAQAAKAFILKNINT